MIRTLVCAVSGLFLHSGLALAQATYVGQVRHAPSINGTVDGSLQQMLGESVTFNSGARITGDLLVTGLPDVQLNGTPIYGGTLQGSGSPTPSNYFITLNSGATLSHVVQRTDAVVWPTVADVPVPTQKALVKVSQRDQAINWRKLRNLTLSGGVGQISVPAGSYGNFSAESGSGFTLGTAGSPTPSVYNFQELSLNNASKLLVAGPVVINLANGLSASSTVGAPANPAWLTLNIRSGGLILINGARFFGSVSAPVGTVIVSNNAQLVGGVVADYLTVNSGGLLKLESPQSGNLPPTVTLTAPANASNYIPPAMINLSATAADTDGAVTRVEFFRGTMKVGEDTTAPFDFTLPDVTAGAYSFFARATDNAGATADSAAITVAVSNPNQAPTITLIAPLDGASYDAPATVTVSAAAGDSDGAVARVDFFQDTTLIGSDHTAPYEATASTLAAGTYVFSALAVDSGAASTPSTTATVTVVSANQAPAVVITAPADGALFDDPANFTVTAKAADPDGAVAKVAFFMNGVLQREDLTAPHDAGLAGLMPGTYEIFARATDNRGSSTDSSLVRVKVAHVNDPPSPLPQTVITTEDSATPITLTATDAEGDPFTLTVVTPPAFGSLSGTAPDLTYTPGLNFSGEDKFTFRASGDSTASAVATVTITVRPINDPPTAEPKNLTVAEGRPGQVQLFGTDIDNTSLQFAVISGPAHGVLSGNPPDLTYTPAPGYHGPDKFVYAAFDGEIISPPAVATIIVTSENDVPVATTMTAVADEDGLVAITLSGTDGDGDALTYSVATAPAHGTLSGTAPDLVYTPNANFHGTDTFTFVARDGFVASAGATVTVSVRPINDDPVAQPQTLSTAEDATLLVVLSAADMDGDSLTYSVVTPPAHGTLSGPGPNMIYTPADNFQGPDSFAFTANDGSVDSAPAIISIMVTSSNDAPTAREFTVDLQEDVPMTFELRAQDQDGDSLTHQIVIPPAHGTLSGSGLNLTYTPEADYFGNDEFAYKVSDGSKESAPVYVTLRVAPVNDGPVGENITVTLAEDGSAGFELPGTDRDSEELTFAIVDAPVHGGLSLFEPKLFYTPVANFNGTDTMTYTVGDGAVLSAVCTVTFIVTPQNDVPVADRQSLVVREDTEVEIPLSASDVDGDTLTYAVSVNPTHGTLTQVSANTFSYQPAPDYHGPDAFEFVAHDQVQQSTPAVVTLEVTPEDEAPTAPEEKAASEEQPNP